MATPSDPVDILHVDDDPDFLELAATHLQRQDDAFRIHSTTHPGEALDHITDTGIDCVITDYDMPDTNGIELLTSIRDTHPDLPVILFTADGSETVASDAISAGVTDYLEKSLDANQYRILAKRVRNSVDRYRAEQGRLESEKRRRRVYERITDGFFAVDSDWEYTYVNQEGARLVDRDETELLGNTVWNVFPTIDDTAFGDALRTAMDTQNTQSVTDYYPGLDQWFDVTIYPDPDGLSIFFRDVTDAKTRDRRLTQAETIFEHAQDAFFLVDVTEDGFRIERVNPAYETLTGIDADTLQDTPLVDVVGEQYWDRVRERYQTCVDAKEPIEYDEELPIGDVQYWHTKLAPVIEDGEVNQLVAATRDITDRRQRQQELERYEAIVENSEDGIYIFDADGYFEFVNQRVIDVSGVPRDAWIGEHVTIHNDLGTMTETETTAIQDGIDAILEEGDEDVRIELTPDIPSEVRVLELRLTNFEPETGPDRVIGFTRDITDRKQSERALQQRNERLDEFASVVSHDLRNPLNIAAGHLDIAQTEVSNQHLDTVAQALDRMEALIDDLLALARAGERALDIEPVELGAVADRRWTELEPGAVELDNQSSVTIHADEARLEQLLANLFRNAIEHGGDTVTVGDLDDGFYVADNGPGIPTDDHETIMEAGFSTRDEGIGFGLAIVDEIADAHGWTTTVTDSEAGGVRFEFTDVTTQQP